MLNRSGGAGRRAGGRADGKYSTRMVSEWLSTVEQIQDPWVGVIYQDLSVGVRWIM